MLIKQRLSMDDKVKAIRTLLSDCPNDELCRAGLRGAYAM